MTSIFRITGRKGYTVQTYVDGRKRRRSFPRKHEAEAYADALRERARAAEGMVASVPFADFASTWLAQTAPVIRAGTVRQYDYVVRKRLLPAFGELQVREVTRKRVRDFIVGLRQTLSKSTTSNVRGVLHAILEAAVEEQMITSNPAAFRSRSRLLNLTTSAGERAGKVTLTPPKRAIRKRNVSR